LRISVTHQTTTLYGKITANQRAPNETRHVTAMWYSS